jgi:hypothetical protein
MTNVIALNSDDEAERMEAIEAFNTVAARYQYLQSEITRPGPTRKNPADKHLDNLMDQQEGALWEVIRTRGILPYQVDFKLQVLRDLIEGGSGWNDGCEFFLLESIRQDVG